MRPIVSNAYRFVRRAVRSIKLHALWQKQHPCAQLLACSAHAAITRSLTAEELGWIEAIEKLRADLCASKETITRIDYGAGLRGFEQSTDAARRGTEVRDDVSRIARNSSNDEFWALVLFKLIRSFRPTRCLEMGTALGISGAYQAAALQLNGLGTLTCLDGSAELCRIAKRNWQALGLNNVDTVVGPFEATLDTQLEDKGPVDYVFVDGHHDRQATLDYFERIAPTLAREALLVFDDIRWSEGMLLAWKAIERDPRVKVSMDFGTLGVCVMGEVNSSPPWRVDLN
jgi:predicted O-methyltransferase YrrM